MRGNCNSQRHLRRGEAHVRGGTRPNEAIQLKCYEERCSSSRGTSDRTVTAPLTAMTVAILMRRFLWLVANNEDGDDDGWADIMEINVSRCEWREEAGGERHSIHEWNGIC